MPRLFVALLLSLFLNLLCSSCLCSGSTDLSGASDRKTVPDEHNYFPLAVGNEWVFRVKIGRRENRLTWRVVKMLSERHALLEFSLLAEGANPQNGEMSVQFKKKKMLISHETEAWKILVLPPEIGKSWSEPHSETAPAHQGTIMGTTDLSVPAGHFTNCIESKIVLFGNASKTFNYFFALGVGPIVIKSPGARVELVSARVGYTSYPRMDVADVIDYFPLFLGNRWEYIRPSGKKLYTLEVIEEKGGGEYVLEKRTGEKKERIIARKKGALIYFTGPAGLVPVLEVPPRLDRFWTFKPSPERGNSSGSGRINKCKKIRVPAGEFSDCFSAIIKTRNPETKLTYWFARKVGPVKIHEMVSGRGAGFAHLRSFRVTVKPGAAGTELADDAYRRLAGLFIAKDFDAFHEGLSTARKRDLPLGDFKKGCAAETCFAEAAKYLRSRIRAVVIRGKFADIDLEIEEADGSKKVVPIEMLQENNIWRIDKFSMLKLFKKTVE